MHGATRSTGDTLKRQENAYIREEAFIPSLSQKISVIWALEMNELHSPASRPSPLPLLHRRVLPQQAQSGKTGQHLNSEALRQPYLLMARVTTHLQVLPGR